MSTFKLESETVNHDALVMAAAAWLKRQGCAVIITEMTNASLECADAIGWKGSHAILVECKTSRADFLADRKKPFRRRPENGMACHRYFCTLRSLLSVEELPEGWGLLEWNGNKMQERHKAQHRCKMADRQQEVRLLLSALRRIGHSAPTGISVKCYTLETKNRASIGIERLDPATPNPDP